MLAKNEFVSEMKSQYQLENEQGHAEAERLIFAMRNGAGASLLGQIMRPLIEAGRYGGVEVGFFSRLATEILA
jgi:hypothetical protein